MKKLLLSGILLSALAAGILSGCTGSGSGQESVDETTDHLEAKGAPGVEELHIGVCIYQLDDEFMSLYREELESYLEAGGAAVTVMDGKNDQAEQTSQIDNFLTQGIDVLIINLVQTSAAEQITDKCAAAGVPAVFICRKPDSSEVQRWEDEGIAAAYVGANEAQAGTYQGEIILDTKNQGDIDGDGKISYVMAQGDMENTDAQYRSYYSVKALLDGGAAVEKLEEESGFWDREEGREIAAKALDAHGEAVEVVFCGNDEMALGALQAIQEAGRTVGEDIYLVGADALEEALEQTEAGNMTGTVFQDHIGQSHKAAEIAGKMSAGEAVDTVNMIDCIKVTQENAGEIMTLL